MEIRPHTEMYVRENSKMCSKDKNKNNKPTHPIFTIGFDIFMNVALNYNGVGIILKILSSHTVPLSFVGDGIF